MDTRPLIEQVGGTLREQRAATGGFGVFAATPPAPAADEPSALAQAALGAAVLAIEYGPAVASFVAPLVFRGGGGARAGAIARGQRERWAGASSAIASAEYDEAAGSITITFTSGRSYTYSCTSDEWDGFLAASSKGSYVNEVFVGR